MFRNLLPALHRRRPQGGESLPRGLDARHEDPFFSFMEEFLGGNDFWSPGRGAFPAVDVSEGDGEVRVSAELPGLEPKDIELSIQNGALQIRGEKRYERSSEKKQTYSERGFGSFQRQIPLPEGVQEEGVKAEYKNGVLTVRLPLDKSRKPQRIEVRG